MVDLISQVSLTDLEGMAVLKDVNIFKRLFDRQLFGWPPSFSQTGLHIIMVQKCLRSTFLTGLVTMSHVQADPDNESKGKIMDNLQRQIRTMLERCRLNKATSELIIKYPERLLWDGLIDPLAESGCDVDIAQLIVNTQN